MNRREFLKGLLGAVATIAIPATTVYVIKTKWRPITYTIDWKLDASGTTVTTT